jgi:hypothetical protein
MEAVVVGLALLAVSRLGSASGGGSPAGIGGVAGWYTAALALALVVAAGVQRRPWGLSVALALQLAMVAGWIAHPALGGLGLLFVLVWGYLMYVRRVVARRPPPAPLRDAGAD